MMHTFSFILVASPLTRDDMLTNILTSLLGALAFARWVSNTPACDFKAIQPFCAIFGTKKGLMKIIKPFLGSLGSDLRSDPA
jgi:hypothetical protein